MIDIKVKVLGGPEIAAKLTQAESGIRASLREELSIIGDEIVARAKGNAPRRTGGLANRIRWYFGSEVKRGPKGAKRLTTQETKWKDGRIRMTVRPFGRVAHLMERGVNATFQQRKGYRLRGTTIHAGNAKQLKTSAESKYTRTLHIGARPFFMPAVQSVGSAAGVNSRLQATLDSLTADLQKAAA